MAGEPVFGYYPSQDKYTCPVCKAENIRGGEIQKHFKKYTDLVLLDEYYASGSENIDDYLTNMLPLESESSLVKLHTKVGD